MAASNPPAAGRIFISYRREETAYPAGWLYDRLVEHFGQGQIFKDVDSIALGDDFVDVINTAVARCDVLLALIGDRWLTITGEDGRRRLEDPSDFVRLEIEAALARGIRVIPVLVDGARMPRARDLPPSLAKLVRRQALELSPSRFDFDTGRLLRVLDSSLAEAQARPASTGPRLPAAPALARRDPGTKRTSVSAQAPGEAAGTGAPVAEPPSPDTAEIQQASEAPGSRGWRILPVRTPRLRAAILIGLGVALATAVTITLVLTSQTGQTSNSTGGGHTAEVSSVAFNQNGTILASASFDHTVRLWNTSNRKQIGQPLEGQTGALMTVALSPDGKIVASGGDDQTVQLWNRATHERIITLDQQPGRVNSVAFSPDGKLLASGSDNDTVLLRKAATPYANVYFIQPAHTGGVFTVAFSPDSKILAAGGKNGTVRLWSTATRKSIGQALHGHNGRVNSVAFSPNGKLLASGGQDHMMRLWNIKTYKQIGEPLNCQSPVLSVAFSHDGKTLACGTENFSALLWNPSTLKPKGPPLHICGGEVFSVAFSPIGNTFATGCGDDTVRLWNAATGRQIGKSM
jgi:TIR domain/WD domain, G-beta repeat